MTCLRSLYILVIQIELNDLSLSLNKQTNRKPPKEMHHKAEK